LLRGYGLLARPSKPRGLVDEKYLIYRIVGVIERRMLKGLSREDQHRLLEALRGCADTLETDL
jgi:hypothetical protein